jgi:ribonuclease VapC
MVIDTSALIAILLDEPERGRFSDAIVADPIRLISTVNALEAGLVIEARKGEPGGREFDLLLHRANVHKVPFTEEHVEEARAAWRRYGKGQHPAGLNFCDCCSYALAKISGQPLLFKGDDFTKTDVAACISEPREGQPPTLAFTFTLRKTYYRQGFFNVPVEYDLQFGPHSSRIEIFVEDERKPVHGVINRTAQRNGTARILGNAGLRDYFQRGLSQGDEVAVEIQSPQEIRVRAR